MDSVGQTALHIAAEKGHVDCVELLLEGGALFDAKDDQDKTPLQLAVQTSLCERGRGQTANESSQLGNSAVAIAAALVDAGADTDTVKRPTGREDLDAVLLLG